MVKSSFSTQRKIFGGTNFVVVLWALISIFRLGMSMKGNMAGDSVVISTLSFMVPLIFLALLNIFIGITLFLPQRKNSMWIISMIIVTATLVVLNTFQTKINKINNPDPKYYKVVDY